MAFIDNVSRLLKALARPVKAEPVFFVLTVLMMIQQPIEWLCYENDDVLLQILFFLQGVVVEAGVAYIATSIVYLCRSKWVKALLYAFFFMLMVVTLFLEMNFKMNISQQTLTVMCETNPKETGEFFDTYLLSTDSLWTYGIDLAAIAIIILCEWKRKAIKRLMKRYLFRSGVWDTVVGSIAGAAILYAVVCQVFLLLCGNTEKQYAWSRLFPHDSMDMYIQTLHGINSLRCSAYDQQRAIDVAREVYKTHSAVAYEDPLTVIYILGESYNKHHASIYGYPLPTTPNMMKEKEAGNLYVFNDVISHENYTSTTEKNTFSLNSIGDGESWFDFPSFVTVFKHSGYDVWMWDMQRTFMAKRLYTITVNDFLYNDDMMRLSYTKCNEKSFGYDGGLVDNFFKEKLTAKHNLVVLHFIGQHVAYKQRCPKGCAKFKAEDIVRDEPYAGNNVRKVIAEYDNAIHYNDAVMKQIFDHFRNENAVLVYTSDHGEEVYDYRAYSGRKVSHSPTSMEMKYQNQVPFVVWCSDTYKEKHPDIVRHIEQSLDRKSMTDVVGHMLLALGGVKSPYYNPRHDITSPEYKPSTRKVYGRAVYDDVMEASSGK